MGLLLLGLDSAHARSLFWPQYEYWWGYQRPWRHAERHKHPTSTSAKRDATKESANGPLQIVISVADQRISLYDNGVLIGRSSVSTGVPGHPTPLGIFSIIGKQRWHRSNLYSAAPMPYMQRITWSGVALHAGVVPGHPASHGCIRLKTDFAVRLWHLTKRGTRVIIARTDTQPIQIAHPTLFVTKPIPESDQAEAAAMTGRRAMMSAEVRAGSPADTQQVSDFQVPVRAQVALAPRKLAPVSVFVSRKASKLFVRQGFTALFAVPVSIRNPEQELGTHVFTLLASRNEGEPPRWTVVTMPEKASLTPSEARGKQTVETAPPATSPDKARAALDRIEIPQDARERISELLTPGSSLIVSDYGISRETGKDTDFIVLTE